MSLSQHFQVLADLLASLEASDSQGLRVNLDEAAKKAVETILTVRSSGGKIISLGNGGSAAIASHLQTDLCHSIKVRALAFQEPPLLTALANDLGYPAVFERPIKLWAEPGDLLIAISSSGKSANILAAAVAAKEKGCRVLTLSGFDPDNPLRRLGDLNFWVPSFDYGLVETAHQALAHYLTDRAKSLIL